MKVTISGCLNIKHLFNSAHILQILQFISIVVLVPALVGQWWVWLREAATEGHSGSCGGFVFCWFVSLCSDIKDCPFFS